MKKYTCPLCMDTMAPRFKRSHEAICAILTSIYQDELDAWLRTWVPE